MNRLGILLIGLLVTTLTYAESLSLRSGWNLVGVNSNLTLEELKTKVGSDNLLVLQGQKKTYQKSYADEGKDFLNDFSDFESGRGYWVKVNSAVDVEYSKITYNAEQSINLVAGWNLINPPTDLNLEALKTQLGTNLEVIQGVEDTYQKSYADEGKDFLNSFQNFEEPKGYWVKVSADATLTFPVVVTNSTPVITGTPKTTFNAYNSYSFLPTVTDADDDTLTFSIRNKPNWAEFNETTGELSGRAVEEGNSTNITISVSDGKDTVSLTSFSIEVLPAINLAHLYGRARHSSTYGDYSNFVASSAIDGDLSTINHTWGNGWLEIALPKGLKIAKVVVYNREGDTASRLNGAKMYMNNTSYESTVVASNFIGTLTAELVQTFEFAPYKEENFLLIKGTDYLHLREVKIYGEADEAFFITFPPKIIKHITEKTFTDDNRTFTLKHDKNGTVASSCGTLTPTNIIANVERDFTFTDLDLGTFKDCNITVTNAEGNISNPAVLNEFTFFKVLNTTKLRGRSDGKGLDYVILADGFQADEMDVFRAKAKEYADYILDYDSNLSLERKAWNIFTVESVSRESGADNEDGKDGTKVDTAFDSYFWCGGTSRLLCASADKASFVVSKYVPQFDKVLIVTNSSKYGGAGGNYATTSLGGGAGVVVHELGHSLAGLADEYGYGRSSAPSSEPYQPNVTINNNLETVKWKHWVSATASTNNPIGLYEGGLYVSEGVWRPTATSIMERLGMPFYSVNTEAWALAVYHTAGVTYSYTPSNLDVMQVIGEDSTFTVEPSMGASAQKITWQVDDINQTVADTNFTFVDGANKNENYKVKAIISDKTGVIRKDTNGYSTQTIEWNVTVN